MFTIDTTRLRTACSSFHEGSQQLNRASSRMEEAKRLLIDQSSMGPIIAALDTLEENLKREAAREEELYSTGVRIADRYDECETEIIQNMGSSKFVIEVPQYRVADFRPEGLRTNNKIDQNTLNELLELFN